MTVAALRTRRALREAVKRRRAARESIDHKAIEVSVGETTGLGERVLGHLFDKQLAFVRDPSKRKAADCGRRSGKTEGVAAYLLAVALDRPGGLLGYIAPTRAQAKRLLWRKLKTLNRHYDLGCVFNETELECRLPNGSVIMLAGADKADSIEKFRGVAFVLVVVDESASFKKHIEDLVEEVLEPTVEDYDGTVALIGTPGKVLAGMFFKACHAEAWSHHHWTVLDNPMFPRWRGKKDWRKRAQAWLERLKKQNAWEDDDQTLLREWMAKWIRDDSTLVYMYDEGRNACDALPPDFEWLRILGIDLGHDDASAFVVVAYSTDLPMCYFEHAEKHVGYDVHDVARKVVELEKQFGKFRSKVIDTGGLGKMVAKSLNRRYHLAVKPAEKKDKKAFQADLNSDLRKQWVKVLPGAQPIVDEWNLLQKDEDGEEDERFDNHCADAGLYGYRESRHYTHRPTEPEPEPGSPDWIEKREAELVRTALEQLDEPDEIDSIWS